MSELEMFIVRFIYEAAYAARKTALGSLVWRTRIEVGWLCAHPLVSVGALHSARAES